MGQEVKVQILDFDQEKRRISLGMKQCIPNPWQEFSKKYKKNDKLTGQIKSITDFGLFIGLEGGIDGLVHIADLSWDETNEEAIRRYQRGQEVEVIIIGIDAEHERISLGIKQLSQDHFSNFVSANGRGTTVKGKVESVEERQAIIRLSNEVTGVLKSSEAAIEKVEDLTKILNVGDEVEAKIINVDRRNKVIGLSIRAKDVADEKAVIKDYSRRENSAGTSLGDIFKELQD